MARPSKYTPERVKRIIDALAAGSTRKAASEYAGIDFGTLENWCVKYSGFSGQLREAEARAEIAYTTELMQLARKGNAVAITFWLERRRPKDWGRNADIPDMLAFVRDLTRAQAQAAGFTDDETSAAVAEAETIMREMLRGSRGS